MRTLKYVIIGLAICSTFALQGQNRDLAHQIILKAFNQDKTSQDLATAADVLQKRLEIFGLNDMTINVRGEQPTITIQYRDNIEPATLERLVTANGALEFCQTFEKQEVAKYITNSSIAKILDLTSLSKKTESSTAVIGTTTEKEAGKVNNYLKKLEKSGELPSNLKFAWSKKVDANGKLSLYALKYNTDGQPLVDGQNISQASWETDDMTQEHQISLQFDEKGKAFFAEATKANTGKVIAVVIDQEVYLAPKIMGEITGGQLQITGDFTKSEAATIAATLGGGKLPFKLEIK